MPGRLATTTLVVVLITGACSAEGPSLVDDVSTGPATTAEPTPTAGPAATDPPTTAPETVVARAVSDQVVASEQPDDAAAVVAELAHPNPSGADLVFQAVSPDVTLDDEWIEVMLPVRPNGTTGWIRGDDVELSVTPYRITIDTSDHRLDVFDGDDLALTTTIAVGTGDTPTPYGDFYLAELLQPPDPGGAYGPYAFGLSGYSEVLDTFNGGNGIVGIHGTNDPSVLGTDVSHGCVRVGNDVITELAGFVPVGSPVTIVH